MAVGVRYRIGFVEEFTLIFIALFFDALSLIPFLNIVMAPVGQGVLLILFFLSGVNVLAKRRLLVYALTTVAELLPFVSMFPALTIGTIILIGMSRAEDREKQHHLTAQA